MTGQAVAEWWLRRPPGYTNVRLVHAYLPGADGTACGKPAGDKLAPAAVTDARRCVVCVAVVHGDETGVRATWGDRWREKLGLPL